MTTAVGAALVAAACSESQPATEAEEAIALFDFVSEPVDRASLAASAAFMDDESGPIALHGLEGSPRGGPQLVNPRVLLAVERDGVQDLRFAEFDPGILVDAAEADNLVPMTLGRSGPLATAEVRDLRVLTEEPGISRVTALLGDAKGDLALVLDDEGAQGVIQYEDVVYQVTHLYGRWHAFATPNESTSARLFDDDAPALAPDDDGGTDDLSDCSTVLDSNVTIDLVVGYTPRAKQKSLAAVQDIESQIGVAELVSNRIFENSGVRARFAVKKIQPIEYVEAGPPSFFTDDTNALVAGEDGLQALLDLRRAESADIAVLVVHDDHTGRCGRAAAIGAAKDTALAVVNWQCMSNKFSYAHEIGHLAGARHDNDPKPPEHAHGFAATAGTPPADFGTVMATQGTCIHSGCGRIWNWSNPDVSRGGVATGTQSKHNNACVWNQNAARLAAFDGG